MTPQTQRKKKRRRGPRRPLPNTFVCIAPDEAQHVYDFIRGLASQHEIQIAKLHFHLCMSCQETVAHLRLLEEAAQQRQKELVHCIMTYSGPPMTLNCSHNPNSVQAEHDAAADKSDKLCMKAGSEQ